MTLNKELILDVVYPVGAIYMSVNSTSPSTLFGGTWEQLKDRFLLGAGDTYSNGATGGEATHTLTVNEMPEHTHTFMARGTSSRWTSLGQRSNWTNAAISEVWDYASAVGGDQIQKAGGSQAHNNMPPYLVCYIWKRTS